MTTTFIPATAAMARGMVDVARKVMARRKVALSAQQEELLREVFVMTRGSREDMAGGRPPRSFGAQAEGEAALARAEAAAIRAFEPVG